MPLEPHERAAHLVGLAEFGKGVAQCPVLQVQHLPPLVDQRTIVLAADELREETDHLEGICARKIAALDELKKSLLHHAFSGALPP
ncbi:MAG: restriction endonuclease subunit S [Aquabacterium sp.]